MISMKWILFIWHYLQQKRKARKSFSQCGEDLLVRYIFNLRGVAKPSYIDIGANHPYRINNTAIFYNNGCRGINIDANPGLIKLFNIVRPGDININVGISQEEGELDFYIMEDETLSTFSKSEYELLVNSGKKLKGIQRVKLTTIDKILKAHFHGKFPDFLSLDVEGMDFEILKSIEFTKSCPKVICVEAAEYSPVGAGKRKEDLINFLVSHGYYEYANTNLNVIMVKKDFWFVQDNQYVNK